MTVKADIAKEQEDWASGDYFDAGKETAAAIELLVPFDANETEEQVELNLKGDAEFVAGFLYGMVGDNHLDEIKTCYESTAPLKELVDSFITHMEHMNFFAAIEDFEEFMLSVHHYTEPCRVEALKDDIASIEAWLAQFKHMGALVRKVSRHYVMHRKVIKADISHERADWAAGSYFKAGADMADVVTLAMGPMNEAPASPLSYYQTVSVPGGYINKVLAGFLYGMTKDNNLSEIEACVNMVEADAPEMKQELVAAINDFKYGGWDHIVQGVLELLLVGLQVPQVLHVCENIQDDVSAIEAWAKNFTDLSTLTATLTKHYLFHRKQV